MTLQHLTELLVRTRTQHGWSQHELAQRSGLHPSQIARLEDPTQPTTLDLVAYHRVLATLELEPLRAQWYALLGPHERDARLIEAEQMLRTLSRDPVLFARMRGYLDGELAAVRARDTPPPPRDELLDPFI